MKTYLTPLQKTVNHQSILNKKNPVPPPNIIEACPMLKEDRDQYQMAK
ncbi:hypothetical protein [Pseudomonas sp. Xaverov 259]|nr:hypothetical protein [Pseudomonas sp. Xaverov 259]